MRYTGESRGAVMRIVSLKARGLGIPNPLSCQRLHVNLEGDGIGSPFGKSSWGRQRL